MNKLNKRKSAFTLIELLVVVAIIGILAAVGVPAYQGYQANAKAQADVNQFKTVTAYVINETAKASMGVTSDVFNNLSASTQVFTDFANYKNPYNSGTAAVSGTEVTSCADGDSDGIADNAGKIGITFSGSTLTMTHCSGVGTIETVTAKKE